MAVSTNKTLAAKIASHISSALRDLGVIFDKYILSIIPILVVKDCVGTAKSCYIIQN